MNITDRFKRLPIGARFTHNGQRYRKCSTRHAFALKDNGIGLTHEPVKFCRSTAVNTVR